MPRRSLATRAKLACIRYQTVFKRLTRKGWTNADWRRELAETRRRTGD
jgi:hypothetical protein